MINSFEMLQVVINDSSFNLTREFELVREFNELDETRIGNDVLKDCEVVIGDSIENVKVGGMLVKKLKSYDGIDTIKETRVCGQKADAVYALTNMSGEVYYFLTWFIK